MPPIVELKNISFAYNGTSVLSNIDFTVQTNDFLALIGPNGGGKTTLIKLILGLLKPSEGTIRIFGQPPEKCRSRIGYLPQASTIDKYFPIHVHDVVLQGCYHGLFRRYSNADKKAVETALKSVDLWNIKDRQIGELSGGQQQRVFLARALARNPDLLLLDEPTASIDPDVKTSFYDLLPNLRKRMAVVLVTHDIGVVASYVEDIACLDHTLHYHGAAEGGLKKLEDIYQCPIELVAHGLPHRVLGEHDHSHE
ncbi:MAG: metal ABC transporter ATP-binding protein [Candidatus Latescibacteria bacterium]|jgi:zinc transport system ATP-binding protein|nr:metal ABC transporter ATP-binding protein [Candidatus Latescibacterota bacterium]